MLEFKIIPTTCLGKPKLALVLYSIQAEPGASKGIHVGSRGLEDTFIICNSQGQAVKTVHDLNATGDTIEMSVAIQVSKYLIR